MWRFPCKSPGQQAAGEASLRKVSWDTTCSQAPPGHAMVATYTKIWWGKDDGNEGDWNTKDNWVPSSLRQSDYQWTASAGGTNEYYLEASGGGDPGVAEPGSVYENNAAMTAGTAGSLAAGEWDWGNNDSLGFNTVYVRLSDGADPDSKAVGYVKGTLIPATDDDVILPPGSGAISSGLDQSAVAIGDFRVLPGYREKIGDDSGAEPIYLKIDPDVFSYAGQGSSSYIDVGSANIALLVQQTGRPATIGKHALYLLGSNLTTLTVESGNVGLAARYGETSTVVTARLGDSTSASLTIGDGVTITNFDQNGGVGVVRSNVTQIDQFDGVLVTQLAATVGTWNLEGGTAVPNSSGTITTFNLNGGTADFLQSTVARNVTTLSIGNKGSRTLKVDPAIVSIGTLNDPTQPYEAQFTAA